ncbi:leucine-rich repeat domain-containing protein [Pedobacter gandavensis]|uniref:leucine-rich repeat domain-containing protein n=1 Tax=Pedobacter gandavensis TaxID=2679963 RepID=UPI00292E8D57|nr:leucine-rich repeat domain-containing protein [Pedobacter gandavensis]
MFMKSLSLSLFFVFVFSVPLFAQDLKEIAGKMSFPGNLPIPRFIITLPDSVTGISIEYEDLKSITAEKLKQLNKIELVELRFSNQVELDQEVELLSKFPSMKYLILGGRYGAKIQTTEIKLPKIIGTYKNIIGLKFSGEWKIDYLDGIRVLKELPNLQYLFFQNFQQPIPDTFKSLSQLIGLSLQSSNVVAFPEWITTLPNLESISLEMAKFNFKGAQYLNYFDVLSKLQKLPLLKNLSLSYLYENDGDLSTLNFEKLEKIELHSVDFKANKSLVNFLTNQKNLRSILIRGSSIRSLDQDFAKLKQLRELSIEGRNDSLQLNFNLKDLSKLRSLELSNSKLFLNQSTFPKELIRLDLSSTGMKVMPNSILKLRKLKTLILRYDSLMILPDNFSDLKQLKHLDLSGNLISALPADFGGLKSLKTLNLSANPIAELTESIGSLSILEMLELQYGNLKTLPSNIGQLKKLKVLNLNDNFLKKIPESLTAVKTLKTLNLSNNQLTTLPEEIGSMNGLEELSLDFNNIRHIPVSIGRLHALKKINLSFNDLDSLPEQIASLSSLEELRLNAGKISDFKRYNSIRGIYRKDDPYPVKNITVNHLKNFPEDLSKWTSLKNLILDNNSQINAQQLMKGLFTIPSKGYSLSLENCGISFLPVKGWENFYVGSLDLSSNQIEEIPHGILQAAYLSKINLNRNQLKNSPKDLNQNSGNRYEKALWFIDLGILSDQDLLRTDSMVLALVKKSNNHYYRNEFKYAVELATTAININDSLAMTKISLNNLGEANYQIGNYKKAIDYLSKAIKIDTAGSVKIMNFITPDFTFRAESYLKLGDTISGINDYLTLAEKFDGSWGEVGVLYKTIGKSNEANMALEKGIENYQNQIAYLRKNKRSAEMEQLALLELLIIKEEFTRAIKYSTDLEKEFKSVRYLTLLRYLKASAEIGHNSFDRKSKPELLSFIRENKKSISGWGYGLFFKWLSITKIPKEKVTLIRDLTNQIKS